MSEQSAWLNAVENDIRTAHADGDTGAAVFRLLLMIAVDPDRALAVRDSLPDLVPDGARWLEARVDELDRLDLETD